MAPRPDWAADDRIVTRMRVILAASALLITAIDPSEPDRFVLLTYLTLSLYTIYSLVLYVLARRSPPLVPVLRRWAHWLDVSWYTVLVALSSGTSSIFFFGFLFAILIASFRWGYETGLRVCIVSAVIFTFVGLVAPRAAELELNRFLLRPIYLTVLGYMIAHWGGFEIKLKRQLALLSEVSSVSNPRFGVDHTLGWLARRLTAFYQTDGCLIIITAPGSETRLYAARGRQVDTPQIGKPYEVVDYELLVSLPADVSVVYHSHEPSRRHPLSRLRYRAPEASGAGQGYHSRQLDRVAAVLDAESFVTVPLRYHRQITGRLYLAAQRPRAFDIADAAFLRQLSEQLMPIIENIRLVDNLAAQAADDERARLARDIHDTVIQPYLAIQLALTGLQRKLEAGAADVRSDIQRLLDLTTDELLSLRDYTRGLVSTNGAASSLETAVRRYVERFSAATGIRVAAEIPAGLQLHDRLAAQVFQMIVEGLSNIRRHTQADEADIILTRCDNDLVLRIENHHSSPDSPKDFTPRSIADRVASLGGTLEVELTPDRRTAVVVVIPL